MGNTFGCSSRGQSSPIMGKLSIFTECQDKIRTVDQSMASLANSLDILYVAARGLAEHRKNQSSQEENISTALIPRDRDQHQQMLYFLEMTVLSEKNCATTSICEFLHFVKQTISQFSGTPEEIFQNLMLDDYKKYSQGTQHTSYEIEELETDNARLKEDKTNLSTHIAVLQEKESNYITEIAVLTKTTEALEERYQLLETKYEATEESNTRLNAELDTLKRKIRDLAMTDKDVQRLEVRNKDNQNKMEKLMNEIKRIELENKSLNDRAAADEKSIVALKDEIEKRTKEAEHQLDEIEKLKSENESVNLEFDMLSNANTEKAKTISSFQDLDITAKHLRTERDQLKNENTRIADKYRDEKEKNCKMTEDFNKRIETERNMKFEYKKLNERYIELEENNERCKKELEIKKQEEKRMLKNLQDHGALIVENEKFKAEIIQINGESERMVQKNKSLQEIIQNEGKMKEQLQQEKKKNESLVIQLTQENDRLNRDAEHTSETIRKLTGRNAFLQEENYSINKELERLKRKKVIRVQLYYQRRGELIGTVEEELICLLKSKMEYEDKFEVEFIKCLNASDVQTDKPSLLLCISASRIGTDAANTIQGLRLSSQMCLLIFHHKDEHALPSQASYQILTGQDYKMIGGVFDFAFLSGKGIYTCPMNESSIAKIVNFINTQGDAI